MEKASKKRREGRTPDKKPAAQQPHGSWSRRSEHSPGLGGVVAAAGGAGAGAGAAGVLVSASSPGPGGDGDGDDPWWEIEGYLGRRVVKKKRKNKKNKKKRKGKRKGGRKRQGGGALSEEDDDEDDEEEVQFLIKWKGCAVSESTWEPASCLCDSAYEGAIRWWEEEQSRQQSQLASEAAGQDQNQDVDANANADVGTVVASRGGDNVPRARDQDDQLGTNIPPGIGDEAPASPRTRNHESMQPTPRFNLFPPTPFVRRQQQQPQQPQPQQQQQQSDDQPASEETQGGWNDDLAQVVFMDVTRVDIGDPLAKFMIANARKDGNPIIVRGVKGHANFITRWLLREAGEAEGGGGGFAYFHDRENAYDLARRYDHNDQEWYLDLGLMLEDVGEAVVPAIRYHAETGQPIRGKMALGNLVNHNFPNDGPAHAHPILLDQWQFPESLVAGPKLCNQHEDLSVLGYNLLRQSTGDTCPQCEGDNPFQFLSMGGEGSTGSALDQGLGGGLDTLVAPLVGEMECVLVHRDDAKSCSYDFPLPLNIEKFDLTKFPMAPLARLWKTTIEQGEILIVPQGTHRKFRNATDCVSYSRCHLDTVNLHAFFQRMLDGGVPRMEHSDILFYTTEHLIGRVNGATNHAMGEVVAGEGEADEPEACLDEFVDNLRYLRNMVQEICNRLDDAAGEKSKCDVPYARNVWLELLDNVALCLHKFNHRLDLVVPSFQRPSAGLST